MRGTSWAGRGHMPGRGAGAGRPGGGGGGLQRWEGRAVGRAGGLRGTHSPATPSLAPELRTRAHCHSEAQAATVAARARPLLQHSSHDE